ncbi:hypothetical protein TRFO_15201 [Tritrichomonas foetus]|uniref:F5/8 type C domain-containing protein n=1 Tax=Tritrichomonas foetus TaxID=1144522 RepID=A0A1J4KXI9_9EUKA|nr:hypothetical protein TRFO_15201 [Tritrichomonas foetus]|eukprot:OHT14422.1 hypothetical protein TRFO_15201 [Tritrichomonas foetus]
MNEYESIFLCHANQNQLEKPTLVSSDISDEIFLETVAKNEKTFTFYHNKKSYHVSKTIACLYSQTIFNLSLSDPFVDSYTVDPFDGDFNIVEKYFLTKDVHINKTNALFLFNVGLQLKIDYFINHCSFNLPESSFLNNEDNITVKLFETGSDMKNVISLLARNFSSLISSNVLKSYPISLIDLILKSPFLNIEPSLLNSYLFTIFSYKNEPNHRLAKYISFGEMSKDDVKAYLNNTRLNMNRLRVKLLGSLPFLQEKRERINLIHTEIDLPTNIFDDLSGLIRATENPETIASSIAYPTNMQHSYGPEMLFQKNMKSKMYFCTLSEENPWFQMEFTNISIKLSGYMLKSWYNAQNGVCPTSWTLEASEDGIDWVKIDSVLQSKELMNNGAVVIRNTSIEEYFTFFRFTQLSNVNPGNKALALNLFELYGTAQEMQ